MLLRMLIQLHHLFSYTSTFVFLRFEPNFITNPSRSVTESTEAKPSYLQFYTNTKL